MKSPPWLMAAPGEVVAGGEVRLAAAEARHALGPLRLSTGAVVVLTDGAGAVGQGTLAVTGRGRATVTLGEVTTVPEPTEGVTLAVGLPAGNAMDLVVQKAVETGVLRLVPVVCRRSQLGAGRACSRAEHWQRLARQALKQCHRAWALDLADPVELPDLVARVEPDRGVVALPDGGGVTELPATVRHPLLLVGPEGGFDAEERRLIDRSGWRRLRLGPHVLRTETAAIVGAAVIMSVLESRLG